jgi:hypothetical protein
VLADEDAMTEVRRIKMKIGDAEFEADVQEDSVQPMYEQFLVMLQRRGRMPPRPIIDTIHEKKIASVETFISPSQSPDHEFLLRIFDMREDGAVTLKVLPTGPDTNADAMLLLLYGYYRLKNEEYVLATQLFRAAEHSGISLRRSAKQHVRNSRFVNRGGRRKGSHYALNNQGLAMAKEIAAKMIV